MYIRRSPSNCLDYCVCVSADLLETASLGASVGGSLGAGISSPTANLLGSASGVLIMPYGLRW